MVEREREGERKESEIEGGI
jgi:hypothetical protein